MLSPRRKRPKGNRVETSNPPSRYCPLLGKLWETSSERDSPGSTTGKYALRRRTERSTDPGAAFPRAARKLSLKRADRAEDRLPWSRSATEMENEGKRRFWLRRETLSDTSSPSKTF